VVSPVPVVVTPPGERVMIQVPVDGRPSSITLPVETEQVGTMIESTTGAVGVGGCALITTLFDDPDIHPLALVTVKV